jgi:pimeloyl-ACP methyl ester carboxylesterase
MASTSVEKSTIVRFSQRLQYAAIRTGFGILERAAPGIGSRLAQKLWLTIPRYRGARRTEGLPLAETFTVAVRGRQITGRAWGSGPTVYLVHGWGGESSQLEPFVQPLLSAGMRVVTFDALGHGGSDPGTHGRRRASFPEMADALTAVVAKHGPAHAIIAHSAGGSATFFAMRHGLSVGRLVFFAPMTQPEPYTILAAAALGYGERIRTGMQRRIAEEVGVPWSEFDMPSHVNELPTTPPLLLVHDPRDRETRYADSMAVQKVWPGATLTTVNGLGHWRVLRDPELIAKAVGFVTPAKADRQVS